VRKAPNTPSSVSYMTLRAASTLWLGKRFVRRITWQEKNVLLDLRGIGEPSIFQPPDNSREQAAVVLLQVDRDGVRDTDRGLEQLNLLASWRRRRACSGGGTASEGERHHNGEDGSHHSAASLHVLHSWVNNLSVSPCYLDRSWDVTTHFYIYGACPDELHVLYSEVLGVTRSTLKIRFLMPEHKH
jgi:hypothetical protein